MQAEEGHSKDVKKTGDQVSPEWPLWNSRRDALEMVTQSQTTGSNWGGWSKLEQ